MGLIKSKYSKRSNAKALEIHEMNNGPPIIPDDPTTYDYLMLFLGENINDIREIISMCIKDKNYTNRTGTKIHNDYYNMIFNIYNKNIDLEISIIETPSKYYNCGNPTTIYRSCDTFIMVVNLTNEEFIDAVGVNILNINRDVRRKIPRLIVGYTHEIQEYWHIQKVILCSEIVSIFPKEIVKYITYLINYDCINKFIKLSHFSNAMNIKFIPISISTGYNTDKIFENTIGLDVNSIIQNI